MNKYLKFGFYILLVIAITIVALLMLGTQKPVVNLETGLNPGYLPSEAKEEVEPQAEEVVIETSTPTFEEDVMKDLESFFGNSNGYENVWWDFWFTNEEAN